MSYLFDAANHRMTGTFTSSYSDANLTIGLFFKWSDGAHPAGAKTMCALGNNSASRADSAEIGNLATLDQFKAAAYNSTPGVNNATGSKTTGSTWTGLVGVFKGTNSRQCYVSDTLETDGESTSAIVVADALKYILVGERLGGDLDTTNAYLAEVAMWNTGLSTAQITSYMGGTAASQIAPSNLIGYWPLSADNATQANLGVDAGGDLTVTTATYSADHPTITSGFSPAWARNSNVIIQT